MLSGYQGICQVKLPLQLIFPALNPTHVAQKQWLTKLTLCRAVESLLQAKSIEQHDCTLLHLGKAYALQADYTAAVAVYLEALQLDTGNAETLSTIGLLYLRIGQNQQAFDFLGNALSHDPKSFKAILAAASVIQASLHQNTESLLPTAAQTFLLLKRPFAHLKYRIIRM